MIYAERGNKVVAIQEEAIPKYVEQGYLIYDENGTVLKETVPTDIPSLKRAYTEHKAKIESLEKENAELKKQLAEAKVAKQEPSETTEKPQSRKKSTKTEEE